MALTSGSDQVAPLFAREHAGRLVTKGAARGAIVYSFRVAQVFPLKLRRQLFDAAPKMKTMMTVTAMGRKNVALLVPLKWRENYCARGPDESLGKVTVVAANYYSSKVQLLRKLLLLFRSSSSLWAAGNLQ